MDGTTQIYKAAVKTLPENIVRKYLDQLSAKPPNVWFAPDGDADPLNAVCKHMRDNFLIASKELPAWHNGSYYGNRREYLYNPELNYGAIIFSDDDLL